MRRNQNQEWKCIFNLFSEINMIGMRFGCMTNKANNLGSGENEN